MLTLMSLRVLGNIPLLSETLSADRTFVRLQIQRVKNKHGRIDLTLTFSPVWMRSCRWRILKLSNGLLQKEHWVLKKRIQSAYEWRAFWSVTLNFDSLSPPALPLLMIMSELFAWYTMRFSSTKQHSIKSLDSLWRLLWVGLFERECECCLDWLIPYCTGSSAEEFPR